MNININDVLILTEGEYSDYHYIGVFKAVKALSQEDLTTLQREFEKELDDDDLYDYRNSYRFANFLMLKGYLEELNSREVHLGAYGELGARII